MKASRGHLLNLALRTCRDAEIVTEERTEVDLASPRERRAARGWGLRVNHEGRLGFAFDDTADRPAEDLLEAAVEDSREGPDGILFAHGLMPPAGRERPLEPDFEAAVHLMEGLIRRLEFMLPTLVPERTFLMKARIVWQRMAVRTRAGERVDARTLYTLFLRSPEDPPLLAGIFTADPDETPAELLVRLAWRAVLSREGGDAPRGTVPAVFTAPAAGALLRDLGRGPLDARSCLRGESPPLGEPWLHRSVTVSDDGTAPRAPGSGAFDGEGLPRRRVALVDKGVLRHPLADRAHARALGLEPQGLAVRDWAQPPAPGFSNLVLEPGESSLGNLAAEVGEGLLLDHLTPAPGLAEPGEFCRRADIAFLLRDGRPAERIPPVLVRGRYDRLLGPDLVALGRERAWHSRCFVPPLAVSALEVEETPQLWDREVSDPPGCWW